MDGALRQAPAAPGGGLGGPQCEERLRQDHLREERAVAVRAQGPGGVLQALRGGGGHPPRPQRRRQAQGLLPRAVHGRGGGGESDRAERDGDDGAGALHRRRGGGLQAPRPRPRRPPRRQLLVLSQQRGGGHPPGHQRGRGDVPRGGQGGHRAHARAHAARGAHAQHPLPLRRRLRRVGEVPVGPADVLRRPGAGARVLRALPAAAEERG
mmetsp:Transcript_20690/g.65459  ORF Transcript_20690/g.65459 Transcript_20690/m.65459 type:complete len:210 (-) Transcript_20690:497-1126(-)